MKKLTLLLSSIIIAVGLSYALYADNLNDIIKGIAYSCGTNPTNIKWCWVSPTQPLPVNASISSGGFPSTTGQAVSPVQGTNLQNSQTTGATNTAVTVTITAVAATRTHVYSLAAVCSAGTSTVTITDGGTTKWSTLAGEIATSKLYYAWPVGLTGTTNSAVVITLATCGVGNTGTLTVQADRF